MMEKGMAPITVDDGIGPRRMEASYSYSFWSGLTGNGERC